MAFALVPSLQVDADLTADAWVQTLIDVCTQREEGGEEEKTEGKAKGDPLLFLFFLFAFHLLSLPRAAVWSQPLESSREKKRRVSLLSSASHLFVIQTPRSGSEQSVTGRTGLSPFHPCLYLHVSHSLFHYLFGGSSLVCTVN